MLRNFLVTFHLADGSVLHAHEALANNITEALALALEAFPRSCSTGFDIVAETRVANAKSAHEKMIERIKELEHDRALLKASIAQRDSERDRCGASLYEILKILKKDETHLGDLTNIAYLAQTALATIGAVE